jgi:hypothetical protein
MVNNKKEQMTAEKLSHMINLDNVTKQIENGWTNPYMIVENVVRRMEIFRRLGSKNTNCSCS